MNIAGLSAGASLILIGVFAFMDYSSFSIETWRTLFFALTMVIAGSIGIVVEFYPFKFLDTWFKLVTCWPGKALYYLFWGLITWDYSNSEIISNGDKWKVRRNRNGVDDNINLISVCSPPFSLCIHSPALLKITFSIIIVASAAIMLVGWIFAHEATAICEKTKFGDDKGERVREEKSSKVKKEKAEVAEEGPPAAADLNSSPNKVETPSWQPAWTKAN